MRCQCNAHFGCPIKFGLVGRSVLCFAHQVVQSVRPISIREQRLRFAPGPFRGTARTIGLLNWMMMKIFASYIWAWFSHSFLERINMVMILLILFFFMSFLIFFVIILSVEG